MDPYIGASDPFDDTSRRQLLPLRKGGMETRVRTEWKKDLRLGGASAWVIFSDLTHERCILGADSVQCSTPPVHYRE